jgi:hypothetical protein
MPALESDLRRKLESVIIQARDVAEVAARSALQKRAVDVAEPFSHFGPEEKEVRNRLRARGRQVGDQRFANGTQAIEGLTQELAYEYWHRMLFARFLAENHLLMHPDGVTVSLEECEELAPEAVPPAPNGFVLAARYASTMLPQIFRTDDVLLEIEFAPEQRLALEKSLASLSQRTFLADDGLGWVYQFWQSKKKEEVNKNGDKIDGRTLSAVTQLFTEHYMVEFLLHNTIGAWWCGRHEIQGPPGGAGVPAGKAPVEMPYLRWRDDGSPAAGKFEGWPRTLAEFTMLDPCCGSGHFLVAAFNLLVPLRMHDEGLTAERACEAVLRDNLFGLELDPRCTQIAAFALALAAWKYPDAGGYRRLPTLNIACSGQGVVGSKEDWTKIGNGDKSMVVAMGFLYDEFRRAPTLGSLINPRSIADSIFLTGFDPLRGTLERALRKSEVKCDPDRSAIGVAAQGIVAAASMMAREFTLVATNVPYLVRSKQSDELKVYIKDAHSAAKADLATAFVERCQEYCSKGGSTALVTPQNWLFLGTYKDLRGWMLRQVTWNLVAKLGSGAFETISGDVVNVALLIHTAATPTDEHEFAGLDLLAERGFAQKAVGLKTAANVPEIQADQLTNPDSIITLGTRTQNVMLMRFATNHQGLSTGDNPRFRRLFWEVAEIGNIWEREQSSPDTPGDFNGRSSILKWEGGKGELWKFGRENVKTLHNVDRRGEEAWGKQGVAIGQMQELPASLYYGHKFDTSVAVILPISSAHLTAIWSYCSSPEFSIAVRKVNHKLSVDNGYLTKIPFDLTYWQTVAAEKYPNGLPEPHSDDPTQWLFKGHPKGSTDPLQVAVARLLGYRWPDQEPDSLDDLADADGIVPVPGVRSEEPASDRLREVLRVAFGPEWSASLEDRLLVESGMKSGTSLDDWLRNAFFEQHCKRFHTRPFVWHIWDGRKDGFSALVNYHKLTHKALENLTYSYLGDWITAQSRSDKVGADLRLAAAQAMQEKLKLILAGEPPYDVFVRWKPLHEQAIGWNPDLNDGVRMNIRPFIQAEILRKTPNIKWTKDRGKEPERDKNDFPWFWNGEVFVGDRVNDVHLTNAEKAKSRERSR